MIINFAGGTGTMGRVHIPILEKAGHKVIVSGRKTTPSIEEAAKMADLTIVSVPIPSTEEVIKKVAPYCKAILDFTTVKTLPVKWMLEYSNPNCEVAGLHPLYGDLKVLKGETIIYCSTSRAGEKCAQVLNAFRKAGLQIKERTPEENDRSILSRKQNSRVDLLAAYALLIEQSITRGESFEEFYETSPPPTRALIDLIARQFRQENDELYAFMKKYNPYQDSEDAQLTANFLKAVKRYYNPEDIRKMFGPKFDFCVKQAEKIISASKSD